MAGAIGGGVVSGAVEVTGAGTVANGTDVDDGGAVPPGGAPPPHPATAATIRSRRVHAMGEAFQFADPPACPTAAWPFLGSEVWARRLRELQAFPCRWVCWRGCSTTSLSRSVSSLTWAARGLTGAYELRSGECPAGGPLTFVRWTPPPAPRAIDLRPLARADALAYSAMVVVDPTSHQLVATASDVPSSSGPA